MLVTLPHPAPPRRLAAVVVRKVHAGSLPATPPYSPGLLALPPTAGPAGRAEVAVNEVQALQAEAPHLLQGLQFTMCAGFWVGVGGVCTWAAVAG